jgi:hypothetical protein
MRSRDVAVIGLVLLSVFLVAGSRAPKKKGAPGRPVSQKQLLGIAGHWWDSPYQYMFERRGNRMLTIKGKRYGEFTAGINGIMSYGGLGEAVALQLQLGKPSFGDLSAIEQLSKLKIYVDRDHSGRSFSRYNPKIVRWGYEHLIPDPKTKVAGHTCQRIYDTIFARFFRLMAASHQHLERGKLWRKEKAAYLKAMRRRRFDGLDYLHKRFAGVLAQHDRARDASSFTVPMAIGFWLRRHDDGTAKELFAGLTRLLELYDRRFLANLRQAKARQPAKKKRREKKRRTGTRAPKKRK